MGLAPQEAAHGPDIPATASSCSQSTTPIRPGADGAAVHRHQAACPARPAWFAQVLRDGLAWPSPQARRQSQPSPQACRTACTRTTRPTVTATPRTARAGQLRVPADPLQRVGRGPCARRRRPVTLSNGATSVADMLSYCIAASLSGPPRRPSTTRPAAARKSETAQAASAAAAGSALALAAVRLLAFVAAIVACLQIRSRSIRVKPNRSVPPSRSEPAEAAWARSRAGRGRPAGRAADAGQPLPVPARRPIRLTKFRTSAWAAVRPARIIHLTALSCVVAVSIRAPATAQTSRAERRRYSSSGSDHEMPFSTVSKDVMRRAKRGSFCRHDGSTCPPSSGLAAEPTAP